MKRWRSAMLFATLGSCSLHSFAAPKAAESSAQKTVAKAAREPMRLTTKSDRARDQFGQAIALSGNYRLDECLATCAALWAKIEFRSGLGTAGLLRDGLARIGRRHGAGPAIGRQNFAERNAFCAVGRRAENE